MQHTSAPSATLGPAPVDTSADEFEAILNQLTALGSEIDQELQQSSSKRSSGEGTSHANPNLGSSTNNVHPNANMKLKGNSAASLDSGQFYGVAPVHSHVAPPGAHHHFSHHYHSQSLDEPTHHHHPSLVGGIATPTSSSSTHRTDSPDNDSAFSDSISLLSTEQSSSSSSSSSSSTAGLKTSSQKSSSASSAASSLSNVATSSSPPNLPSTPSSAHLMSPSGPSVHSLGPPPPNSPLSSTSTSDSSTLLGGGSSSSTLSSLDHQLMALNQQQELFFEQLGGAALLQETTGRTHSLPTSPSKGGSSSMKGHSVSFDKDTKDDSSPSADFYTIFNLFPRESIILDVSRECDDSECDEVEEEPLPPQASLNSLPQSVDNQLSDQTSDSPEKQLVDEKIKEALEKIREANYRKLYLKVFAPDNSAKSLLADERMTIGAICGQLASKNYISMDSSLCIIEHMPSLYLERFFEDHESLVENVLHWGRDTSNKLYFMQRSDKYDLFAHPEKYLISGEPPSSAESTLKSSSAQAASHLRNDLISQFFNPNSGLVKVPEIDGDLYLRVEGKKSWKKYFFTLRSSGLYYCAKGRPKSTKDLICLATFDLNALYLGFGWRKKFKAPSEWGFAIKHPQVQAKSPKHIKYLCAESEEQLRLWCTGIRIAKYGRLLYANWEQYGKIPGGNIPAGESEKNPQTNGVSYGHHNGHHLHQQHSASSGSVIMRSNRVARDESARSSSTSSASSGCMSEGASTGSGHTSVSNPGGGHHHFNGGVSNGVAMSPSMHLEGGGNSQASLHYLGSPTHHYGHFAVNPANQQSSLSLNGPSPNTQAPPTSGFDTDFPLGTIKRKPSVGMMPKIPLTKNTRNLALQSEDALLEVNESDPNGTACYENGEEIYSTSSGSSTSAAGGDFQRGTFKSGTLRRSTTDERMKAANGGRVSIASPLHHLHQQQQGPGSYQQHLSLPQHHLQKGAPSPAKSDSEDELPPPPPSLLKESASTLSLSAFPPPPPEILASPTPSPPVPLSPPPPPTSGHSHAHYGSMTPQPTPKNSQHNNPRLARRLSDLSSNSTIFLNNYRNGGNSVAGNSPTSPGAMDIYGQSGPASPMGQQQQMMAALGANSRASIATSGGMDSGNFYGTSGFVTLKPYHSRAGSIGGNGMLPHGTGVQNRLSRQLTLDLHSLSKYGTTPRIRNEAFLAQLANEYSGPGLAGNGSPPGNGLNYQLHQQQQHAGNHSPTVGPSAVNSSPYTTQNANNSRNGGNSSEPSSAHLNGSVYTSSASLNNGYGSSLSQQTQQSQPSPQINEMLMANSSASGPQLIYGQMSAHAQNGGVYPNGHGYGQHQLPPPPPQPMQPMPGAITSRPSSNENVIYMSISPHLLKKHQAMATVNSGRHFASPQMGPMGSMGPLTPPVPPHANSSAPPEQIFLKNMERVMQKNWQVAQRLREEHGATPGQVLGFRDPAYLPPRTAGDDSSASHVQLGPSYGPGEMNGSFYQQQQQQQQNSHYHVHHPQGGPMGPSYQTGPMYGTPPPQHHLQQQQQEIYGTQNQRNGSGKSVRIAENPTIFGHHAHQHHPMMGPMGPMGPLSPSPHSPLHQSHYGPGSPVPQQQCSQQTYATSQQAIYGSNGGSRKVPPPPPKRSENTHLTTNGSSSTSSRR